ncbi:MAG: phospholipid carrier-dependent glycosyltransferase [Chloroflexota bacterium]
MTTSTPTRPWLTWPKSRKWAIIGLMLFWIFAVLVPFYVVQKPFTLNGLGLLTNSSQNYTFSANALLHTIGNLFVALCLWLINLGVGLWFVQWIRVPINDSLERITLAVGLGFGGIGLLMLGLGLVGLLSFPVIAGFVALLLILTLKQTMSTWQKVQLNRLPTMPTLYIRLTLVLGLTIALLPATDWDGLFYHLTGPKLYLEAGRIVSGIDIPHLNFPSLFEMHFLMALIVSGPVTAKLLHFIFVLHLMGLVFLIAQQLLHLKDGWWAILFLLSMPMVLTLAGWAYNDLALAFYQVGALYGLIRYQGFEKFEEQTGSAARWHHGWLILSAIFCGLAMSLKYTSFVAPVSIVLLLLWGHWKARTSLLEMVKPLLVFAIVALAVASPWYIKNFIFTGNPVYPFVFSGQYWDAFRTAAYSSSGTGIGFNLLGWVALPYQLTLGVWDANYIDGRTGPLFLVFLPLLLFYGLLGVRRINPTPLNYLLFFALAQYLFWMLGVVWSRGLWQSRLLLPAFVAVAPALAWILQDLRYLNLPQFSLQRFLKLMIALVLILGLVDQLTSDQFRAGWLHYQPWQYLTGTETEDQFLRRRLGHYALAMKAINDTLPDEAVVTFLWEPRSFYCQVDCRPDSILDEFGHLQYLHGNDPKAITQALQDKGITHILVHRLGYNHLLEDEATPPELRPNAPLWEALEADHLDLIFDIDGSYQGYRLP